MSPKELAEQNLAELKSNPNPGGGLILGVSPDSNHLVQIYLTTGTNVGSRNRVFGSDGGRVFTELADESKGGGDTALTIYNAMRELGRDFVVSSGSQTDDVYRSCITDGALLEGLTEHRYEPDEPNFTPRITGVWHNSPTPRAEIAILRKSIGSDACDRLLFRYGHIERGFGYCATTYTGDGNPLPPFQGEPKLVPISGTTAQAVMETYWFALQEVNRVSLAVKWIDRATQKSAVFFINKYAKI